MSLASAQKLTRHFREIWVDSPPVGLASVKAHAGEVAREVLIELGLAKGMLPRGAGSEPIARPLRDRPTAATSEETQLEAEMPQPYVEASTW